MTDITDLIAAIEALNAAERGDLEPLAKRLDGGNVTPRECTWLAGHLRGENKQRRGRPKGRLATIPDEKQTLASQFKARFDDKYALDLFACDYVESAVADGMAKPAAKGALADALGESVKSIEQRLKRVAEHLQQGGIRIEYLRHSDCEKAKQREVFDKLAELLTPTNSRRGRTFWAKLGRLIGDDEN